MAGEVINVGEWIHQNQKDFLPPVCNKMMHKAGQMKCFFVGGPNQRKDFHIECGEELFYMRKGDMVLKVVEKGRHRDIEIKEGQVFLLPSHIAHSPQRYENTIGLVLERERHEQELDGLRYFIEDGGAPTNQSLYEEWFHCDDLGTQLAPIIKRFFASQQYATGKPIPGTIPENPPVPLDSTIALEEPFLLADWLTRHKDEISEKGFKQLYADSFQFQVFVYGPGTKTDQCEFAETFIWQLEGEGEVTIAGKTSKLSKDDSILVPEGERFTVTQKDDSYCLVCYQDPSKSTTWKKGA